MIFHFKYFENKDLYFKYFVNNDNFQVFDLILFNNDYDNSILLRIEDICVP